MDDVVGVVVMVVVVHDGVGVVDLWVYVAVWILVRRMCCWSNSSRAIV